MTDLATLYQTDYAAWAQRNAELLRERRFSELDIEHLLEELTDMSRSDRRELYSRLLVLPDSIRRWLASAATSRWLSGIWGLDRRVESCVGWAKRA